MVSSLAEGKQFAAKSVPDRTKLRGGYYTPASIASFLAEWVAAAGPVVMDPACGDGAILGCLAALVPAELLVGVELMAEEAEKARSTGAQIVKGDFFRWFQSSKWGGFDGVAGNPPYIRFGNWAEEYRDPALRLMRAAGLSPNRLTNAWVPFVVAALLAVRPGGRIGLVLPAEVLQVNYAAQLRSYLVDQCSAISVVSFDRLVFPGLLQEVVLLLAERGVGPASIRTVEVGDPSGLVDVLGRVTSAPRAQLHESEKWTKYYLEPHQLTFIRSIRRDQRLCRLGTIAQVDVGVVSGRNSFFCLSTTDAERLGVLPHTIPLVSRSAQLKCLRILPEGLSGAAETKDRLLVIADPKLAEDDQRLSAYIAAGVTDGVHEGYKCRIRRNWYQVPSVWMPDAFMLRQIHTHPRLIANLAGATSTDTVHRVRLRYDADAESLAVGAFNSLTFAAAEVIGRSYGGGILELEPNEAEELPVPPPEVVPVELLQRADALVRAGRTIEALSLVDRAVLQDGLGFTSEDIEVARSIWIRLEGRRNRRARTAVAQAMAS